MVILTTFSFPRFHQWRNIPGGPLPTLSWNQTIPPDPSTSVFVLQVMNSHTDSFPNPTITSLQCSATRPISLLWSLFLPAPAAFSLILLFLPALSRRTLPPGNWWLRWIYLKLFSVARLTPSGAPSPALVSKLATLSLECRMTGTRSGARSGSAQPPLSTSASLRACATIQTPALSTAGGSGVRTH